VAIDGQETVGMAIYRHPGDIPDLFENYVGQKDVVYVAEVVVHAQWSGRGIGSGLLNEIAKTAKTTLSAHELGMFYLLCSNGLFSLIFTHFAAFFYFTFSNSGTFHYGSCIFCPFFLKFLTN